jgi:hypothetical protein
MITQERLKQRYRYNKHTGVFTRLFNRAGAVKGTKVTTEHGPSGHLQITVDRKIYPPANLAWLYVYGVYPDGIVDHKDRNPKNNRIKNLRLATNQQNAFNRSVRSDSILGIKCIQGVPGRYRVRVTASQELHHIGYFSTLRSAKAARNKALRRLHGEFARAA